MRPLDRISSIKVKLGLVIVGAVFGAVAALVVTNRLDVPLKVSTPIAALVALAFVQVLARGMTSPLRELARATAAMAKGDYSQRVRASSRDEVGELARAFNRMAVELRPRRIDLGVLLADAVADAVPLADGVELAHEVEPPWLTVVADPERLHQ